MNEIGDAGARQSVCAVAPDAGAARRYPPLRAHVGHLGVHQCRTTLGQACRSARGAIRRVSRSVALYMHMGDTQTRFCSVIPRSEKGRNIGGRGQRRLPPRPCVACARCVSIESSQALSRRRRFFMAHPLAPCQHRIVELF